MASTWSPYKVQLMATGENLATWGNVTNANLGTALTEMITGSVDVTFASADVTLTLTNTTSSQSARNLRLNLVGTTGGSARNLIVPALEKAYIVNNTCGDAVTIKNATGTGVSVPAGKSVWVFNDGTNVTTAFNHFSTPLSQAAGGTGQSSLQITQYCGTGSWSPSTTLNITLPADAVYAQTAGQRVSFLVPTASPSGTISLKVGSNASATLVNSDGSALAAGDLATGIIYTAMFDGTSFELQNVTASVLNKYAQINSGTISGYICSNNVSNPNTQLDISVGNCRDTTNTYSIVRAAGITKKLDAVWAAGTGQGGRDVATALAAGQTWHVHAILDPVNNLTDVLFSQSATAPTLPSGYTAFRRVMSIVLEQSSTAIKQFVQTGSYVQLKTRNAEFSSTPNSAPAGTLRNMYVPTGLKLRLDIYYTTTNVGGSAADPAFSGCFDPDVGVPQGTLATGGDGRWAQVRVAWGGNTNLRYQATMVQVYTNTNAQIYTASNDTGDTLAGGVVGWLDPRDSYY